MSFLHLHRSNMLPSLWMIEYRYAANKSIIHFQVGSSPATSTYLDKFFHWNLSHLHHFGTRTGFYTHHHRLRTIPSHRTLGCWSCCSCWIDTYPYNTLCSDSWRRTSHIHSRYYLSIHLCQSSLHIRTCNLPRRKARCIISSHIAHLVLSLGSWLQEPRR